MSKAKSSKQWQVSELMNSSIMQGVLNELESQGHTIVQIIPETIHRKAQIVSYVETKKPLKDQSTKYVVKSDEE